jgi:hypothetical protein
MALSSSTVALIKVAVLGVPWRFLQDVLYSNSRRFGFGILRLQSNWVGGIQRSFPLPTVSLVSLEWAFSIPAGLETGLV